MAQIKNVENSLSKFCTIYNYVIHLRERRWSFSRYVSNLFGHLKILVYLQLVYSIISLYKQGGGEIN
jgi:hypothetical protein